jgi:peroxiredoxin
MNRRTALLASSAIAMGASALAQAPAPPKTHLKPGDMAPDFELTSTAGGKVKLSSLRGQKNVVLAFFPAAFTGG